MTPVTVQRLSLVLLLAAGLSLLVPLFGRPLPPRGGVAGVLGVRLGLQAWLLWQEREEGGAARPALTSLLMTVLLLGLLLFWPGGAGYPSAAPIG